jgi:hypothetical protein
MSLRNAIAEAAGLSKRMQRRPPEQSHVQARAGLGRVVI